MMQPIVSPEDVVVSDDSFRRDDDPSTILFSNVQFLNALFGECIRADEVSPDALTCYLSDSYMAKR
jgi:hypothetical protein